MREISYLHRVSWLLGWLVGWLVGYPASQPASDLPQNKQLCF